MVETSRGLAQKSETCCLKTHVEQRKTKTTGLASCPDDFSAG